MTTIGPFPIVTEITITEPGWYWFEPGCPDAGSRPGFVNIDPGIIESKHQLNCRKWRGRYAGPFSPPCTPKSKGAAEALNRLREANVLGSTSVQLECWMLLDAAVDELAKCRVLLDSQQDSTWASLNKYSHALGWGLSGIQPECWMLLDSAVDELKKRRALDEQIARILTRMRCGCLCLDCTTHGSYVVEDIERASGIIGDQRLSL